MKRNNRKKIISLTITVFGVLSILSSCGGGSGAPPVSIPAPVSQLISVSEPGDDGLVLIAGAPGAVNPFARVIASLPPFGGPMGWQLNLPGIRNAYAQLTSETLADDQGGFFLEVPAMLGDQIGLQQDDNGDFSDEIILNVPCNPCN